ncbi:ParM/StbA family protein [Candidatus Chloroploca sp. M-50]|uniref:ParM/StbA family protein n=1 Tax=Candidatus Chloroploca mongolica TaxID=2528176 RepID=A0ABS4D9S8_9CHLR|nr:ParM/StbA family protein [Candidatus Chloroploca mongolica]MBP1466181.1 ParM/StbA family protein [Candidatus Chloroploca mongolica]
MQHAGHGPNIGHGYVKYVIIDAKGCELPPVIFPAMISPAGRSVTGALAHVATVRAGGGAWWSGEDALLAGSPLTILAQERLTDPVFLPVLLRSALHRLGALNGTARGVCVTGLPATWALDHAKARALGAHLRDAHSGYSSIRVIPEPLGLVYAAALDNHGHLVGDPALLEGQIAVVDLGHHTVDLAVLRRLVPVPASLDTYHLGTSRPLQAIRARLSATFERELTLFETDQAVRAEALLVAGEPRSLPHGWDRPLLQHGEAIAARLVEAWGRGSQFDTILIGGGGAELAPLVTAIQQRFRHAQLVAQPQTAIARGYARLARRLGGASAP